MKDCFKQLKAVEESVKKNKSVLENGEDPEEAEDDDGEDDADGKLIFCSFVRSSSYRLISRTLWKL